jgi:uncharacterized membrane protein YfcA
VYGKQIFCISFFSKLSDFLHKKNKVALFPHTIRMYLKGKDRLKRLGMVVAGLMIGVVNGLLGAGGGMLTVPVLSSLGGLSTKKSHATAIGIILPLTVVSAIMYTIRGIYHVRLGLISAAGITVGGLIGAVLLNRIPKNITSLVFYTLMIAAGTKMLA